MKRTAWNRFAQARDHYRMEIERLSRTLPDLQRIQQKMIDSRTPSYTVETPIVYNQALDDVRADSDIRLILVADNPGRREQAAENRRYLVGPSGKIAEKFFRDNPALKIDFRQNVIILNKTPIHTPRTIDLKELRRQGGAVLEAALAESQRCMAQALLEMHQALNPAESEALPVWITGYSEMKKGGVFEVYTKELSALYEKNNLKSSLFLFRHFSMNQFTVDLKRQGIPGEPLTRTLSRIGASYRDKYIVFQ